MPENSSMAVIVVNNILLGVDVIEAKPYITKKPDAYSDWVENQSPLFTLVSFEPIKMNSDSMNPLIINTNKNVIVGSSFFSLNELTKYFIK